MSVGSPPPPGWWRASDGNWYPPELHPRGPVPRRLLSRTGAARKTQFRLVSTLLALGILAAATGIGVIAAPWSSASDLAGKSASQVLQGSLQAAVAQGSAEVTEQISALGALKIRA